MGKYKVESFNLDHTRVTAPYVRLASAKAGPKGDVVSKFDIRITQPNTSFMPVPAIHTLEHLAAESIRDEIDGIIDFSPMGCRTGFYLCVFGEPSEAVIAEKMIRVFTKAASWPSEKAVPGLDPKECGNYKEHDLAAARSIASEWVREITEKGFSAFR